MSCCVGQAKYKRKIQKLKQRWAEARARRRTTAIGQKMYAYWSGQVIWSKLPSQGVVPVPSNYPTEKELTRYVEGPGIVKREVIHPPQGQLSSRTRADKTAIGG